MGNFSDNIVTDNILYLKFVVNLSPATIHLANLSILSTNIATIENNFTKLSVKKIPTDAWLSQEALKRSNIFQATQS